MTIERQPTVKAHIERVDASRVWIRKGRSVRRAPKGKEILLKIRELGKKFQQNGSRVAYVYALYWKKKDRVPYYVGIARGKKLRLGRVNKHLRDRHKEHWRFFSMYFVRPEDVRVIESLFLRICMPEGNRVKGGLKGSKNFGKDRGIRKNLRSA